MTEKLETVLEKISTISNPINSSLIQEFYQFMVNNRKSDSYKKNNLKALILFSHELAPNVTFYDVQKKNICQVAAEDPNKKITKNCIHSCNVDGHAVGKLLYVDKSSWQTKTD